MVARVSDVTSDVVSSGEATLSQIAQMFHTDAKTLPQRMKGIPASGKRNGYKVYRIVDAASRLVKPGYEIEEFIRQMSPQELPPLLSKEFWNGQKARLAFEKELGNLWPTEDVVEMTAVLSQGVRQVMVLLVDDIDREEGFTDGQRKAFRRIMDAGITTMNEELTKAFKDYYANRDPSRTTVSQRMVHSGSDSGRVPDTEDDEEVDI